MASMPREALAPETFRPRLLIRSVVLFADTLWIVVFCALTLMRGATQSSFLGALFFIALFTACTAFYHRLAYTVTDHALMVRLWAVERVVPFEEILRVDVVPGFVGTTYAVRTRAGSLTFSSLLGGHERLCSLIVRRAQLS
jgi:hypothetical protein